MIYHINCIEMPKCINYLLTSLSCHCFTALHQLKTGYQTHVFCSMSNKVADIERWIVRAERNNETNMKVTN